MICGLSVVVTGELRGFEEAHRLWGWCRFAEPSVELATEWTVDVELVRRIQASDRRGTPSPLALGSQASQQRVVPIFPRGEAAASRKDHSAHTILPYTVSNRG